MTTHAIFNAPIEELERSSAASRIKALATESQLFLSHFERRYHWPTPEEWQTADQPGLAPGPQWINGQFTEHKFRHFRYDNPIGSFNPAHRAKWTTHELCHGLVGFAWRPDASRLFHSLAARLSEVLPVTLWYFLDEADLNRCDRHQGGGALFDVFCPDCERAAQSGPKPALDTSWYTRGRAYLEGELSAINRSKRLGRAVEFRHATLNLATDSLAWTTAHYPRLSSPEFAAFRERFLGPDQGCFGSLEELEGRVWELFHALVGERDAAPLAGDRWLWTAQDLAWRIQLIGTECEGEVMGELDRLIEQLADTPNEDTIRRACAAYVSLGEEYFLPPPEDVFALGYPLPDAPMGHPQILDGLEQALPNTAALMGDAMAPVSTLFAQRGSAVRGPLSHRFARFLSSEADDPITASIAEIAHYEASVSHPGPADLEADSFNDLSSANESSMWTVASGLKILDLTTDVSAILNQPLEDWEIIPKRAHHLAIRRHASGDTIVAEISETAARELRSCADRPTSLAQFKLSEIELKSLRSLGLLVPVSYPLTQ